MRSFPLAGSDSFPQYRAKCESSFVKPKSQVRKNSWEWIVVPVFSSSISRIHIKLKSKQKYLLKENYLFLFGKALPKRNSTLSAMFGFAVASFTSPISHPHPGSHCVPNSIMPRRCQAFTRPSYFRNFPGNGASRLLLVSSPGFFTFDQGLIHTCWLLFCSNREVSLYVLYLF